MPPVEATISQAEERETTEGLRSAEAFRALALAQRDALFRVAARMLSDDHAAEDAVQEAFARAFAERSRFRGESAPATWLFGVLLNVVRRELRRRKVRGWLGLERAVEAGAPSPVETLERSEQEGALREAIAALPAGQREALVLVSLEGVPVREAAQALGCSEVAVWKAVSRGRASLKRCLHERS